MHQPERAKGWLDTRKLQLQRVRCIATDLVAKQKGLKMIEIDYDPVGPGTPAWNQFEKALAAYSRVPEGCHSLLNKHYKAYTNHRYQMTKYLKSIGMVESEINIWRATLTAECKGRVMNEFGEYL